MTNPNEPDCIEGDFSTDVEVDALNNTPCEVYFHADTYGVTCLSGVKVLEWHFSADDGVKFFGPEEWDRIEREVQIWWEDTGECEAREDEIAARADKARDEWNED